MSFYEKHFVKPLFEGGKVGRIGWSIVSCIEFFLVAQSAWNHSIIGVIGGFVIMCTCLLLAHMQTESQDNGGNWHRKDDDPDPKTPNGDAVEAWLKKTSCLL